MHLATRRHERRRERDPHLHRPPVPGGYGRPPFSGAVRVGDTLYLSGNIGIDENFEVPEDLAQEARTSWTRSGTRPRRQE